MPMLKVMLKHSDVDLWLVEVMPCVRIVIPAGVALVPVSILDLASKHCHEIFISTSSLLVVWPWKSTDAPAVVVSREMLHHSQVCAV